MLCGTGMGPAIPCQGDSGGPLLVQDPETKALNQAGVISFGAPGCAAGSAPVFANVAAPALGLFVATNAAKLQAAADASRQAAGSAPLAAAPATPAPTFTASQALQRMTVVIRRATGRRPAITRTGCSRVDGTSFRCAPAWHDRSDDYRGRLTIGPDRARFDGQRASRRCRQARTWSSCARAYRFT
jgi:secreted trypsin-like serine protease